jgi:hypothetical protein
MGMGQLIELGREKQKKTNEKKGITIWKYYRVAVLHFPDCFPLLRYPGIASNEGELELEVGGGHRRRDRTAAYAISELGRHGLWNSE